MCCQSSNTNCNTYIKLTAATTALRWWYPKITISPKSGQKDLWMKKYGFWFFHFNNFFVTPGQIPAIFNLQDPIFFRALTQPKPPAFQNISSIFGNQYGKSFYSMAKLRKPIWLQSKRPKFWYFFGLKAVWRKIPFFLFRYSESCMSHFWWGTKVNPDKFSSH